MKLIIENWRKFKEKEEPIEPIPKLSPPDPLPPYDPDSPERVGRGTRRDKSVKIDYRKGTEDWEALIAFQKGVHRMLTSDSPLYVPEVDVNDPKVRKRIGYAVDDLEDKVKNSNAGPSKKENILAKIEDFKRANALAPTLDMHPASPETIEDFPPASIRETIKNFEKLLESVLNG